MSGKLSMITQQYGTLNKTGTRTTPIESRGNGGVPFLDKELRQLRNGRKGKYSLPRIKLPNLLLNKKWSFLKSYTYK